MNIYRYVLLALPISLGLSACSSSTTEVTVTEVTEAQPRGERDLKQSNPFEWSQDDVSRGDDGNFSGGKRSTYDKRKISSYGKDRKAPDFFSREYHSTAWNGSKDYSSGSYRIAKKPTKTGKRSWFGGKKSSHSGTTANEGSQSYSTGNYRTSAARESGSAARTGTGAGGYVESRRAVKRKPLLIIGQDEYRKMSVDQTRSLLGR